MLITALRDRSYLLSGWPWRSALFVGTTALIAAPVSFGFWLLVTPWLVAGREVLAGRTPDLSIVFLMAVGAAMLIGGGPLVALPLATLERARLRLIDSRPIPAPHRFAASPVVWLAQRFREESTWRAVLYAILLAVLAPLLYFAGAVLTVLELTLLASPWLAEWDFGGYRIDGGPQSIPFTLLGIVLFPVLLYLAGLVAAAHGVLARRLLGGGDGLRDQLTEVAQSRARLADAFDAERRRIERDLHDGAQHRLTSLTLHLGMARLDVPDDSPAAAPLHQAHDQAKELMVVLRDLVHGIRPQVLTDLGLPAALRELAATSPVPVSVDAAELDRLPERIETTAYFVAAEALTNVAKHAHATSVQVRLTRAGDGIALEILDDGLGGADPRRGSGLTGLADRVGAVGGKLLLASPAGGPTLLRVEL
ncbi:sensor domain-containing protein [Actinoplanes sp. NEAU-A12]|uniref:histidine kinase n=1 Tax=Actinoplanes sandaracinus TaxID=3045177 RepID=A0ABT6WP50_9ACTN|nr:sensor histidine kinase [Actinoplanes sandaracinus]MDI6101503.1 sensor domain-containing protein [Actinoplanes sandaracinus]